LASIVNSGEEARKDAEIKELRSQLVLIGNQLERAESRVSQLETLCSKLEHFKKNVLNSFGDEVSFKSGFIKNTGNRSHNDERNEFFKSYKVDDDSFKRIHNKEGKHFNFERAKSSIESTGYKDNAQYKESFIHQQNGYASPDNVQNESTISLNGMKGSFPEEQNRTFPSYSGQRPNSSYEREGSPSNNATETVDGRAFFKRAKQELSYDQFMKVMWFVKTFNQKRYTRESTIESVKEVIGQGKPDLIQEFENLMYK
jgi:hypothetical protein